VVDAGESAPVGAFESFVAAIPDPVLVADATGTVVTGNDRVSDVFGRELSVLRGESLEALFSGVDRAGIEANCEAGGGEYVTGRALRPDGPGPWVELAFRRERIGGREFLVCVVHDVTARHEREQTLERYERIVETVDDGVYTLDETFTIETVNDAIESITGYESSELVGSSATMLADESVIDEAIGLSQELASGDREFATLTADLRTADGDRLPVETRFSTYPLGEEHGYVGVVRDISERREFERTLAALHDATRTLLEAESAEDIARLVVESALDILEVPGAAVYRFDRTENVLEPAAAGPDGGEFPVVTPGDGPVWESFVDGEATTAGGDGDPTGPAHGVCLPLGSYGVLSVAGDPEEYDPDTVEVLDMLAASAEAVLARVARERSLWERDEKLQKRNRQLRRHKEVNAIIRRIDRALVDADTREEIEQAVCDQITTSEWVSFAWLGSLDTGTLTPRAWAGDSPGYLDAVSLATAGDGGPPGVRTARSDATTVVPDIAEEVRDERWRAEAVARDFRSVTSVPLRDEEFTYGVLSVYGTEPSAFEGMLQSVFAELGDTIANAIRDVESRQRRSAPSVTELEVSLSAPTVPLGQLAGRLGRAVVCEGAVPGEGDTTRLFFRVEGTETDSPAVRERGTDLACVETLTPVTGEAEASLFEAVVTAPTVAGTLVDRGLQIDTVRAEADGDRLGATVSLPPGVGVRGFVERLDDRYEGARLEARRERPASDRTPGGIRTALADTLTDRQLQVLRTAYLSGFFDWPRECSGQDLADRLDISQPTMSRHLRVGERKLLELVFED
jgi:PAS domain S-box-containing protein